jgi:hypothetical protein
MGARSISFGLGNYTGKRLIWEIPEPWHGRRGTFIAEFTALLRMRRRRGEYFKR